MSSPLTLTHQRPTEPIEPGQLRRVCGLFVTGVTVITTGVEGREVGTTVNSFTSVSLDPPLVLFCLHKQSRLHESLRETGGFAVNFLAAHQESLARSFAGKRAAAFDEVAHHRSAEGVPVLSEALAHLMCRTVDEYPGGDHTIILGEVVEIGIPEPRKDPLIFFEGTLGTLPGGQSIR